MTRVRLQQGTPEPVLRGPAPLLLRGTTEGARCRDCPFSKDGQAQRPVVGEGIADPDWIIVGEGPGQNEVALNHPFVGASGQLVNKALDAIGCRRNRLFITNATLCLPTPDATDEDKHKARKCCAPRFVLEMAKYPGKPVLALGNVATQAFLGSGVGISAISGSYHQVDRDGTGLRVVIPTLHPAAILRGGAGVGGAHAPDLAFWNLMYDAAKINSIAAGKDIVFRDDDIYIEWQDPKRAEELIRAIVQEARRARMVAVDTETYVDDEGRHSALQPLNAKLSAIGLATPNWGMSVAWNVVTPVGHRLLAAVMADPNVRTVMHNKLYDRPVLRRHRMPVFGPCDCTLLKHHNAFPGLAHGLQRVATQYFAIAPWKSEFRHGKDTIENLTRYCLSAGTPITLTDGTTASIEDVVRQRRSIEVLTRTPDGTIGKGLVTDWHKNRITGQRWVCIQTTANHVGDRGLIVTPDHKVYTSRGPIPAAKVTTDDRVALPEVTFTDVQHAAVLGTLLGDSTLAVSPSYRGAPWTAPGYTLQGGHISENGLTKYKVAFLHPHARLSKEQPPGDTVIQGCTTHKKAFLPYFTRTLCQLLDVAPLIYSKDWKRQLRVETLQQLGSVGLAWWFMDDGCYQSVTRGRGLVTLATNGFERDDVDAAVEWFRENYGATSAGADRVIRLAPRAAHNFCEEIAPHIIPTLRYKLVKQLRQGKYQLLSHVEPRPYYAQVTESAPYEPLQETRGQRLRAETRFCITVEDDHNFFTSFGLVANCAKDTLVTARLDEPLDVAIEHTRSRRTYEIDLLCADAAEWMYDVGIPISREVNQKLYDQFWTNMQKARKGIEDKANEPEIREKLWDRLAFEQAKRCRHGSQTRPDSENYIDRQIMRLEEIRKAHAADKWEWKIGSADHLGPLLQIHGLQLDKTSKGKLQITLDVLKPHRDDPIVKALYEYRKDKKNEAAKKIVEDAAARLDIRDELWKGIAFEQAKRIRQPGGTPADPEDFEERQKVRLKEIEEAYEKGNWFWKIGSSDHIAAYLKARGVPMYFQTDKGATSTRKEILEGFAHLPEVRSLIDFRENQKMFSTFVYSFFDRHDEEGKLIKWGHAVKYGPETYRLHPRWNVHRITGRWSAEDPQCFDGKTEILTEDGWVRFDQLIHGKRVAQFWKDTHNIDFIEPTYYVDRPHHGDMISIQRRNLDLLVTPDHRLLVRSRKGKWQDTTADAIKSDYSIPVAGHYEGGTHSVSEDFIALLCAAQADGTWNGSGWDFQFTRPRKIERLRKTLDNLTLSYRIKDRVVVNPFKPGEMRKRTRLYVHKSKVGSAIAKLLGATKSFGSWLLSWTRLALNTFCEEVMFWDGSWTCKNCYSSSNKVCADWVQTIFILTGKRARLRPYNGSKIQQQTNWQVDVCDKVLTLTTHAKIERTLWIGRVYCVSVPSTYIVIRRGKNVMISGQCQNWPKANEKKGRPNLRSQVVAPDGRTLVGFDFCLAKGTLVETPYGPVPIEKLRSGDFVFSFNRSTSRPACSKVVRWKYTGNRRTWRIILDNGKEVRCTPEHRWLRQDDSEVRAQDLTVGERLLPFRRGDVGPQRRDLNHKVSAIIKDNLVVPTYDIEVECNHNFALSTGVFVHNSQLEARIIALLSGDPFICNIFNSGKDIHSEFARIVWPDYDELPYERRKVLRDSIKRPEYGAFFGGSVETLWQNIKKDYPDVQLTDIARMVSLMTAKMPGVTIWHQQLLREVAKPPHEIRSAIYGRRRCFPLGNADINDVYNFPVQCGKFDQRVLTTSGLVPYQDLTPTRHTLVQPSGRETSSFTLHDSGVQTVYEIRTKNHTVICTAGHRFLVLGADGHAVSWIPLRELQWGAFGNQIAVVYSSTRQRFERVLSTTEEAAPAQTFDVEIHSNDHGYIVEGLVTHNSTGADIMATGLLLLMPKLRRDYHNAAPIIQIHDAIVFECDEGDAPRLQKDVQECFEQTHTHNDITIHFPVDPTTGRSWADV